MEISIINVPSEEWRQLKREVKETNELLKMMASQSEKKYLTVKEAAKMLKCTVGTIHRYLANGTLTAKERTEKRQKILIPAEQIAKQLAE